ncbi:MAG: hypothetical protein MK135_13030, partial [Polyangiaceae bacterium]|nr:hypothetical protein [Polyangiaceae bacterium]
MTTPCKPPSLAALQTELAHPELEKSTAYLRQEAEESTSEELKALVAHDQARTSIRLNQQTQAARESLQATNLLPEGIEALET